MKKRSTERLVRVEAGKIPPPTKADLERLKKAMARPVDTSDMPEWTPEQIREAAARRPGKGRRIPKVA